MESFARALWIGRAMMAGLTLAPALLAALRWAPAGVLVALAIAVQVGAVVQLRAYLAAIRDGRRGEILMADGQRIPRSVLGGYLAAERAEHAVGALAAVAAVALSWNAPAGALVAAAIFALQLLLLAVRYAGWQQHRAYLALMDGHPAQALHVLRRFKTRAGPLGEGLALTRSSALQRLGELTAAERVLEDAWAGAYNRLAAALALHRLGRGEPELARAWLASRTEPPDNRHLRYLHAVVRGHLALHDGTLADLAAELAEARHDLPRFHGRELDLLRAAAHHLAGQASAAREALQKVDRLDDELWRVRAQPQLWATLEQLRSGQAPAAISPPPSARTTASPSDAPTDADPFAAPATDRPSERASQGLLQGRQVGAIPVELAALTGRQGPVVTWVLRVLTGLLLLLSAPLSLLLLPGFLPPDPVRTTAAIAALVGVLGVVLLVGMREGVQWLTSRGSGGVRLFDGRLLSQEGQRWWWLWSFQSTLAVLVLMVVPAVELAALGSAHTGVLVLLLFLLTALGGRQFQRVRRACAAVHFAPVGEVVDRVTPNQTHHGAGWMLLAYLVDGRVDDAAAYLDKHMGLAPGLDELALWVRAGRGEASLVQLLQRPTPTLASRYRIAVAQRLAALHSGDLTAVADEVAQGKALADELPNRLGGLLHRTNHAVQARVDPTAAERYATSHRHELRQGAWARGAWPALLPPIDGIDGP